MLTCSCSSPGSVCVVAWEFERGEFPKPVFVDTKYGAGWSDCLVPLPDGRVQWVNTGWDFADPDAAKASFLHAKQEEWDRIHAPPEPTGPLRRLATKVLRAARKG